MSLHVPSIDSSAIYEMVYAGAARGRGGRVRCLLPFVEARVDGLPEVLDAIIATSDLQGREWCAPVNGSEPRLLGEALADDLAMLRELEVLPPPERTGILLAGDLWARPLSDRRGGLGDVRSVFLALVDRARWVAGCAGNHDRIGGSKADLVEFMKQPGVHFLEGRVTELDGLRIGGVGGAIQSMGRPYCKSAEQFERQLVEVLDQKPDLLLLHDGPDGHEPEYVGHPMIRGHLERAAPMLVLRGHKPWPTPLRILSNGTQVLNLDHSLVVMRRDRS